MTKVVHFKYMTLFSTIVEKINFQFWTCSGFEKSFPFIGFGLAMRQSERSCRRERKGDAKPVIVVVTTEKRILCEKKETPSCACFVTRQLNHSN